MDSKNETLKRMKSLFFITGNNNKFSEISQIFNYNKLSYKLLQLAIDPVEIQADSLKDVALFKLASVKKEINGSYFVEDAGFFVDKPLNGFPGVYSSYVFKTIGNEGILNLIENYESAEAHFSAIIALYYEPLDEIYTFEGVIKGKISKQIKGTHGFGYDPIFIPNEFNGKTFSELTITEKNSISHRSIAINKMIQFLKTI